MLFALTMDRCSNVNKRRIDNAPAQASETLTNNFPAVLANSRCGYPKSNNCDGNAFDITVTVNPKASISNVSETLTAFGCSDGMVPAGTIPGCKR